MSNKHDSLGDRMKTYDVKCSKCGQFCIPFDYGVPYGGPLDLEPPDTEYFCETCVEKISRNKDLTYASNWWIKPQFVELPYVNLTKIHPLVKNSIENAVSDGISKSEIDSIYDIIKRAISKERYSFIDCILQELWINIESYNPQELVAYVTASYPAREHLHNRRILVEGVKLEIKDPSIINE